MLSTNRTLTNIRRQMPLQFHSVGYKGDMRFLRNLEAGDYLHKWKQCIKNTICFLDKVSFGDSESNVRKILGEPFFIYRNQLYNLPHTVYSYGLKSGSIKLKAELHFVDKNFVLGTIFYATENINFSDLNHYFQETFKIETFHFKRDIIVDPFDNFLEFHSDFNCFIVTFSKLKWINSTSLLQNMN